LTLKPNQPRRGHLRGTSTNTKAGSTGRGDGQDRLQNPKGEQHTEGYPKKDSLANPAKTGRAVPTQGNVRGYRGNAGSVGTHGAKPTSANHGVGRKFDRTNP